MAKTKCPIFNKKMKNTILARSKTTTVRRIKPHQKSFLVQPRKITAKKCTNTEKCPRKQLVNRNKTQPNKKQPNQQNNKKNRTTKQQNVKANKKIAAEKRKIRNQVLKEQKRQERYRKQPDYSTVIEAYKSGTSVLGHLGDPHEYTLPPQLRLENRELEGEDKNYLGKHGRKIAKKLGDCGLCLKIFRNITRFKNHMPFHDQLHLFICMFCVLAGRDLIDCCFVTEDNLMNHMLRYEFTSLSVMEKGKLKNPKKQNTPELQKELAYWMRMAYELPEGIQFHGKLKKIVSAH